jgi:hypothetical protein
MSLQAWVFIHPPSFLKNYINQLNQQVKLIKSAGTLLDNKYCVTTPLSICAIGSDRVSGKSYRWKIDAQQAPPLF